MDDARRQAAGAGKGSLTNHRRLNGAVRTALWQQSCCLREGEADTRAQDKPRSCATRCDERRRGERSAEAGNRTRAPRLVNMRSAPRSCRHPCFSPTSRLSSRACFGSRLTDGSGASRFWPFLCARTTGVHGQTWKALIGWTDGTPLRGGDGAHLVLRELMEAAQQDVGFLGSHNCTEQLGGNGEACWIVHLSNSDAPWSWGGSVRSWVAMYVAASTTCGMA